jgi:hypothetical protein
MSKIEISSWEIAEKLGLCYTGDEETVDKWHDVVCYRVYDFHGRKIRITGAGWTYKDNEAYNERAAEIVLFNIGRALAESLTDWID